LKEELEKLSAQDARVVPGGVSFSGGWEVCYAANLWSRIASRVLWRVGQFEYGNENDLYAAVRAVDWPNHFRVERTLRVNVTAQKSPLKSLEFATLRIKDAVCDRFRDAGGGRPDVERSNPDVRVHAFLEGARGTLYLDTSGEPLFKRGERAGQAEAPLRENLAAGIIMLSGWRPDEPLLDPMCGGATLLVDDPNDANATESWVLDALKHLPLEQRMAIELAYYLGHSCEEIGAIMQCPVSTVKARMFHARQKLKQLLPQLAGEVDKGST